MSYNVDKKYYDQLVNSVEIPKYQRALVWSMAEKKNFIDSLKNGYPFGSLLMYKYEGDDKYSIIDGLQRFSTIKSYSMEKHKYINLEKLKPVERLIELINLPITQKNGISEKQKQIIREVERFLENMSGAESREKDGFIRSSCEILKNITDSDKDYATFSDILWDIDDEVEKFLDYNKIIIPFVEFTGDQDKLAEVFERLNRGGKKLSKYQVFAAQWYKNDIYLEKSNWADVCIEYNIKRYENLNSERMGIEIENYDSEKFRDKCMVNLSEFCYSLGAFIIENSKVFYGGSPLKNEDDCNSIGFATMAIIFNKKNNKISEILNEFEIISNPKTINLIFENVEKIVKKMDKLFSRYLKVSGKEGKYLSGSSQFQFLAIFASYWIEMVEYRDEALSQKDGYAKNINSIEENIIKHFIYENIRSHWAGSGDNKLDKIAFEFDNYYMKELNKEDLQAELSTFSKMNLEEKTTNITYVHKLLTTIHMNIATEFDSEKSYEYEHIIVRDSFKKYNTLGKFPGGHFGNICLITEFENRSKNKKNLYQYNDKFTAQQLDIEFLEKIKYPERSEIRFLEDSIVTEDNIIKVKNVIKSRADSMIEDIIERIYNI